MAVLIRTATVSVITMLDIVIVIVNIVDLNAVSVIVIVDVAVIVVNVVTIVVTIVLMVIVTSVLTTVVISVATVVLITVVGIPITAVAILVTVIVLTVVIIVVMEEDEKKVPSKAPCRAGRKLKMKHMHSAYQKVTFAIAVSLAPPCPALPSSAQPPPLTPVTLPWPICRIGFLGASTLLCILPNPLSTQAPPP